MECETKIVHFQCFVMCCGCFDCWTLRSTSLLHTKADAAILGARYVIRLNGHFLSHSRHSFLLLFRYSSPGGTFHSHTLKKFFFYYLKTLQQNFSISYTNTTNTYSVGSRRLAVFHGVVGEFLSSNGGELYE